MVDEIAATVQCIRTPLPYRLVGSGTGEGIRMLSERLELRLSQVTMEQLRREASERHITVAAIVREAIDQLLREDRVSRVRAAEALFQVEAQVSDWATMKREIEEAHTFVGQQ